MNCPQCKWKEEEIVRLRAEIEKLKAGAQEAWGMGDA
jgi:hypothetical protein